MSAKRCAASAGVWQHLRAVVLLPFTNTVVIPVAILAATGRWDLSWLRSPGIADVAAASCAAAGLAAGVALVTHAIGLFVRVGRGTLAPWDPTRALVVEGAYRHMRNPMKAGLFLVLFGEAALLRSLPLLAWLAAFALANVVYIRVSEEPGLRARFGRVYDEYCAQVPRWLPNAAWHRSRTGEAG